MENYCIREDYRSRSVAETFVDDPAEYWNAERIRKSTFYQYYVYKVAARLAGQMDRCNFADIGCGFPSKSKELILPVTDKITLMDQPSMKDLVAEHFPEMRFIPIDLEKMDVVLQEKFDCIVCSDVIEHLLNPDSLLKLIRETLYPEGTLIISTPERDIERGPDCLASPKAEHVREWNSEEFVRYLSLSGFRVLEHHLLPKGRLTWIDEVVLPLARRLKTPKYCGCQVAVCKLN